MNMCSCDNHYTMAPQIKYYVIKHLILQKIQNMMDINEDLLQGFANFFIKRLLIQTKEQELILV